MSDRTTAVRSRMAEDGFDALVVCAPPNMAYVSGFRATPHERLIAIVLPREGALRAVVPSLEQEAAASALSTTAELFPWRDEDGPRAALERAVEGLGGRVGIEKSYLTVAFFELAESCLSAARFEDCGPLLAGLRVTKDAGELELLRRAANVVDAAVESACGRGAQGGAHRERACRRGHPPPPRGGRRRARLRPGDPHRLEIGPPARPPRPNGGRTGRPRDRRHRRVRRRLLRGHHAHVRRRSLAGRTAAGALRGRPRGSSGRRAGGGRGSFVCRRRPGRPRRDRERGPRRAVRAPHGSRSRTRGARGPGAALGQRGPGSRRAWS